MALYYKVDVHNLFNKLPISGCFCGFQLLVELQWTALVFNKGTKHRLFS